MAAELPNPIDPKSVSPELMRFVGVLNERTYEETDPDGNGMEVKGLTISYKGKKDPAVADISLPFARNRITALIGPSGSGKTTILRALNRMDAFNSNVRVEGSILLDGEDVTKIRVENLRKRIGLIFQEPNPFPTASIADNVTAGISLWQRMNKGDKEDTVEKYLTVVGLWDDLKDRLGDVPADLSGGQQQRLCIARAIANQPDVLLMDEPCSKLDPISTLEIEELMRYIKTTVTIIIVTHRMEQAARVSDYTAHLDRVDETGKLVSLMKTKQMFTNPFHKITEEYITGRHG